MYQMDLIPFVEGYLFGSPENLPFDHWIQQSPNVVIVSVYYRLSSFGFLATPAFRGPAHGDLNAGFLDQIEALRWVKRNIAAFGGDSMKVTINGQSAGGSSVGLHLVAEEGEVLFRAAIVQSLYRTPLPSPEEQEVRFISEYLTNFWRFSTSHCFNPTRGWLGVMRGQ